MQKHDEQSGAHDETGRWLGPEAAPSSNAIVATSLMASAQAPEIYLTAASYRPVLGSKPPGYSLMANWTQPRVADYEYVYIYDHAPPNIGEAAGSNYSTYGKVTTDGGGSYFFDSSGPGGSLDELTQYWAAYVRYEGGVYKVVARTQFRWRSSNWMAKLLEKTPAWGGLKLNEIFIPASHDTGTFDMSAKGVFGIYNQTQTLTFVEQLDAGVRFFDIRMGYYHKWESTDEGPFFTVHADWGSNSAWSTALKDIAGWLSKNPTEIVFLNIKWEGNEEWTRVLRTRVLQLSYDALKSYGVLPKDARGTTTIDAMVKSAQRVVLSADGSYDQPKDEQKKDLAPSVSAAIRNDWFDKYYVDELIPALDRSLGIPRHGMWAAGTVITPHKYNGTIPWGVYSLTIDGIDRLNHWIRVNSAHLNVVPVDFVEVSAVLPFVAEINEARAPGLHKRE